MAQPKSRRSAPVAGGLMALIGAGLVIITIIEGVWYPFWAAHASHAALARSWGGPSAAGATLVHWLVGLIPLIIGLLLFRAGRRLARRRGE